MVLVRRVCPRDGRDTPQRCSSGRRLVPLISYFPAHALDTCRQGARDGLNERTLNFPSILLVSLGQSTESLS